MPDEQVAPDAKAGPTMADHPSQLLLITDEVKAAALIETTMAQLGYGVTRAQSEAKARRVLAEQEIDLIICERLMTGFDTFRLIEEVMFDSRLRHIPIIYLAPEGVVVEGYRARSDIEIVLERPLDPLKLAAGTATLLERGAIYTHVIREDPLTGLLNRATIETEVTRELNRVRRYQCTGSLIYLDLDNFKRVNDQFGHAVGDQTLVTMAGLVKANIRNVDLAGRLGGEEFVIYLPETAEKGAATLAWRLLKVCLATTDGPPGVTLSFSAGVVETPRDGEEFAGLVERADQAMYAAKQAGKGRVEIWRKSCAAEREAAEA